MNTRIHDSLTNQNENYILPFFWQHGEDEETLRHYMGVIQDMGIHAVCLESRPHPDFAGPKWWHDMDIFLDEAQKRNMKIWILDDCHFPTGYANGAMKDVDPSLQKWVINHLMVDLVGPSEVHIDVNALLSDMGVGFPLTKDSPLSCEKELLCAVLYKRADEFTEQLAPDFIDLTDRMENGMLPVSVPEGFYRLFLIYKSTNAGLSTNDYVNLLQKESVKILLDAVYEPHYERYKEYFGNTIAGFFSDEPGFYNCIDNLYNYDAIVGQQMMPLPWSSELEKRLFADHYTWPDLVRLWHTVTPDEDAACRYQYMNHVSRLYEENFSLQLGDWCRGHNVEYIGHILEDNNCSSRLGPSAGHYFRAMTGQDMSGIDVVTSQILPGRKHLHTTNAIMNSRSDGEFYHYALSKLGASDAHLCPEKRGRAMCELFGNYGWVEGAETMKWLTDFMLVRGINVFVPHAFSPGPFPDPDCPPHFYAHGNNLQAPYLKNLFDYMNRVSHILNNGKSASRIGILYHAEAEWSGNTMLFQKPGRICMEHQADYDVIPADKLTDGILSSCESVRNPIYAIGDLILEHLIIPAADRLPYPTLEALADLSAKGFPVIFIDALPKAASEGIECTAVLDLLRKHAKVLPLCALGDYIEEQKLPILSISSGTVYKDLRAYQYKGNGYECVMLMNESIYKTVDEEVRFSDFVPYLEYDAYENRLYALNKTDDRTSLHLEPGEAKLFVSKIDADSSVVFPAKKQPVQKAEVTGPIALSVSTVSDNGQFRPVMRMEQLQDLSLRKEFLDFHGTLRYELNLEIADASDIDQTETLYLDGANEVVTVTINDQLLPARIGTPYRFEIGKFLKPGKNHLIIDNITTVYPLQKDNVSINTGIHPMGICGKIWMEIYS